MTIFDLPEDLLVNILRRLGKGEQASAVCKTFRDVCHARATSVTLSRPYILIQDDAVVATMAGCPNLVRATATGDALKSWVWPTGTIAGLRHLTVPVRWPEDEISSTLLSLDLTGDVSGARAWMDRVLAKMTQSQCVITLQAFKLAAAEGSADWEGFEFSRLQFSSVSVGSQALASEIVTSSGPPIGTLKLSSLEALGSVNRQLRCLELYGDASTSLRGLAGPGLASLTSLDMTCCHIKSPRGFNGALPELKELGLVECGRLRSLQGLAGWRLSKLEVLCLNYSPVTSLRGLAGAGLGALWWLGASGMRLTDLVGLSAAGLSEIKRLDISDNRLTSLEDFDRAGLTKLTHLDLSGNPLTSLRGLGELPALVELDLSGCSRLQTLQPLVAARLDSLRLLCVTRCSGLDFDSAILPSAIELCEDIEGI
jgi:hypothetical protein